MPDGEIILKNTRDTQSFSYKINSDNSVTIKQMDSRGHVRNVTTYYSDGSYSVKDVDLNQDYYTYKYNNRNELIEKSFDNEKYVYESDNIYKKYIDDILVSERLSDRTNQYYHPR